MHAPHLVCGQHAEARQGAEGRVPCRATTALLLLYYCFTPALLLLYSCFTPALLLLYCQAIEWGVKVVNHLWLLDSITVWRWEPEAPYLAACGKEMLERRATLVLPLS